MKPEFFWRGFDANNLSCQWHGSEPMCLYQTSELMEQFLEGMRKAGLTKLGGGLLAVDPCPAR